jgi:hypothetical protein
MMAALGWLLNLGFAGGSAAVPPPASPVTGPAELLALSLAASTTWQAICGAADAGEARRRIYFEGLPLPEDRETHQRDELIALRPYALIYPAGRAGRDDQAEAGGTRLHFRRGGRLILELVRNGPDPAGDQPPGPATLDWSNRVGQIMEDLCGVFGSTGYLAALRLSLSGPPYWCSRDQAETQGLWQAAELTVDW